MYNVNLEQFQGPLDLLLQLAEKNKLDITEISLAKITDQYLNYIKNLENISLESLADFLVVASRLILIKSRMLLPELKFTDEEEEDIKDLKEKLKKYKKFKSLAGQIGDLSNRKHICYSREKYCDLQVIFYPPKNLDLNRLKNSFKKILKEISVLDKKLPEEKIELKISLEEKINYLQNQISNRVQISFQKTLEKNNSKMEKIISFLALLELVKQGLTKINQKTTFGEIFINKS